MSDLAERLDAKQNAVREAMVPATESDETAAMRRTRRLLLVGIPLFWSSWYIYNAYISVYVRKLGATLSVVGLTVAAYGLTQLILRIPVGVASDRLGVRKPFVLAGSAAGALGCLVMLLAATPWAVVIGRGLAGVGAACWVPLSLLLIASYPKNQIAKATAMVSVLSGLGNILGSAAGGQLAQMTNDRVPFGVGIVLGIVAIAIISQIKEPQHTTRKVVPIKTLLSVGKVPLVLLVSILALLNQYNAWATTQGFVPIYAADLHATKAQLGLLMSVWQACNTVMAFGSAWINARLGTRWTVVLGMSIATVSTLLIPLTPSIGALILLRGLHGVGQGIAFPVLMAGSLLAVSEERRGAAMGFFQAIYAIGMVAGPAISGLFADSVGLATTFYMLSALGLVSVVVAVALLPHHIRQVTSLQGSAEAEA